MTVYGRGDPGRLREMAVDVRAKAGAFQDVGAKLEVHFQSPSFQGPLAARYLQQMRDREGHYGEYGGRLRDAAAKLESQAGRVEQTIAAIDSRRSDVEARYRAAGTPLPAIADLDSRWLSL